MANGVSLSLLQTIRSPFSVLHIVRHLPCAGRSAALSAQAHPTLPARCRHAHRAAGCGAARQGDRLGGLLLADALRRAYASAAIVGSSMVVVDAIGERAATFTKPTALSVSQFMRLVLPTSSIAKLFA